MSAANWVVLAVALAVLAWTVYEGRRDSKRPTAPGVDVAYSSLVGRIEDVEDKYNRLERRFTRIQAEFNALTRMEAEDEPLPEEG